MLYDSENALIRASNTLYSQGEQLENSSRTMNRMHKDLNVTETLVNGLDRWFTKWDVKPEHYFEICTKKEYPILYRKTIKESYSPGTLVFIEGQVTVLNVKRVADVSILLKDLTSIVVNTPWNILLLRSAIGEVDVIIDVSSAQVVYILKFLQPEHGDKFHYEDDSGDARQTIKISEMPMVEHFVTEDGGEELGDADLETVGDVVGNLKSLALGINQEMTRQFDRCISSFFLCRVSLISYKAGFPPAPFFIQTDFDNCQLFFKIAHATLKHFFLLTQLGSAH